MRNKKAQTTYLLLAPVAVVVFYFIAFTGHETLSGYRPWSDDTLTRRHYFFGMQISEKVFVESKTPNFKDLIAHEQKYSTRWRGIHPARWNLGSALYD